jgi:hypothetical protein
MKTDKNTLFRAIGEIDEKYVSEILQEDASKVSVVESFEAAKAATNAKKKASGTKKFLMYYLPAVAGFLLCAIIVKSFMTSNVSESASAGNSAATADCAAPEPAAASEVVYDEAETNGVESMDAATVAIIDEDEDSTQSESAASFGVGEGDIMIDGMPNPFVDCDSLEEACEIAGIDLEIPDDFGFEFERIYRAMDGRMIEVIFMDGSEEVYRIRKGLVSEFGEDISGDYNEYSVSSEARVAGCRAELFGNSEDEMMMARWNDGEYAYSITCEDPIPEVSMIGIMNMMMEQ